jgi:Mn-dependent DtxR family transcriptional regulator
MKTSVQAYMEFDSKSLHDLIRNLMSDGGEWCFADVARKLKLERSTVSARLNELRHAGALEYTGKRRSKATNVTAMHFRLK